jgi:hypothetical protein
MKVLELFNIENKYKLPDEFKGKTIKNGGLTINNPRKWTMKDFVPKNFIKKIVNIGEVNKKELKPIYVKEWQNILRVYFSIK